MQLLLRRQMESGQFRHVLTRNSDENMRRFDPAWPEFGWQKEIVGDDYPIPEYAIWERGSWEWITPQHYK